MAYKTRVCKIYAAFSEADHKKVHRLAKKDGVSAAQWVYEATQVRILQAANLAKISRALAKRARDARKAGKA